MAKKVFKICAWIISLSISLLMQVTHSNSIAETGFVLNSNFTQRNRRATASELQKNPSFVCWERGGGYAMSSTPPTTGSQSCSLGMPAFRNESDCSKYVVCGNIDFNVDPQPKAENYFCECRWGKIFNDKTLECEDYKDPKCPILPNSMADAVLEAYSDPYEQIQVRRDSRYDNVCGYAGKFPIKNNCYEFIQCSPGPGNTMHAYVCTCPYEKSYSPKYRHCIKSALVKCATRPIGSKTTSKNTQPSSSFSSTPTSVASSNTATTPSKGSTTKNRGYVRRTGTKEIMSSSETTVGSTLFDETETYNGTFIYLHSSSEEQKPQTNSHGPKMGPQLHKHIYVRKGEQVQGPNRHKIKRHSP